MSSETEFVTDAPSPQNVLNIFDNEWSTIMPAELGATARPGLAALFSDPRIQWSHSILGPFEGLDILELGPLEGAHSYMLEQMGAASVTAIEGNARAFLKCLCVKELMAMRRVSFRLGNFVPYLEACRRFDAIIACGVLYHMTDPVRLLERITDRTDRVMIWTHVYDPDVIKAREDARQFSKPAHLDGTGLRGSKRFYSEAALSWKGFSGGSASYAIWLERASLLRFFEERGFRTTIGFDQPDHSNGPALALCARR